MSDYTPILPQELITDILLRLPGKPIGQFRCVSRPWLSLLSDSHFIKSHSTLLSSHDPGKFILVSDSDHTLHTITLTPSTSTSSTSSNTSSTSRQDAWETVVGSCHGLVLVRTDERSLYLINPTTLERVKIPSFPLALDPSASFSMHGFGYDDWTDDYKIVTLSYYDTDNEHEPDCADTFVDVYSVKTRTWKRFDPSPYDHAVPDLASGVFLNGGLHWLASDRSEGYPSVIAVFLLDGEDFEEVPPPSSLDRGKFVFNKLVVLEGCLGIVVDNYNDQVDVWVMKQYRVQESWTKFTINVHEDTDMLKPICKLRDEEIVLEKDDEKLVLHSLRDGISREMVVAGLPDTFEHGVMTFSETLLSPNFYSLNAEMHNSEGQIEA
ncbi:unnamed protein product [Coffea canephora]|uniref:DH200=94 genomic scaffold, scaffold_325 n=1 Tax=Coffea canephora TaxID=49390 RepID=A0A068VDU0_COFCA|nr:unnamed protein product [Coffea canephora]